jgi:glyoxylase-like metal-dependent hydrolase (beta-lactamase superfamily II)
MNIQSKPCGAYMTNCYIVTVDAKDFIIDPGVDATQWVLENAKNPVAILNTHGHFDHVWSNAEVQKHFNIPIYIHKNDSALLENDPFGQGTPPSKADFEVQEGVYDIAGVSVMFRHFPGHTPGCSVIEIGDSWFSGDFLFRHSIGRYDFPLSSATDMKESLRRALQIEGDYKIYPGHGDVTSLVEEKKVIPFFISQI